MNLAQTVQRAEDLIRFIDDQLTDLEVGAGPSCKLVVGCLDAAREHHKTIVLLVAHQLPGSAMSLVRVLFEFFVWGAWLHHCATNAQIDKYIKDSSSWKIDELLSNLEKIEGFEGSFFSDLKRQSWKAMNSFTHTGMSQISRRFSLDGFVGANYEVPELVEVVNFSCGLGWLTAIDICRLAGDDERAMAIMDKVRQLFPSRSAPENEVP